MTTKEQVELGKGDMPRLQDINRIVLDQAKKGFVADDFNLSVPATVEHLEGQEYEAITEFGGVDVIFDEELEPGQFRFEMKDVPVADRRAGEVNRSR